MQDSNPVGTRLGKYEIRTEIGRGGMGAVYKGYDPALDRYVAVKVLAPHLVWEKESVERFVREARSAAKLKHPDIVTIYDVGQEGGWYYFVMEYLEGEMLTAVIEQRGPLPSDEAVRILRPLADALDYAHHRGLVHRDIKPGNVHIGLEGHVTLTDFGIARAAQESRLTATGTIVGTPEYMSPEQVRGLTADARSDQYSLAVVAYEMLSGRVPFEADSTLALLHMVAYEPPPPIHEARADLPVGVQTVLARALAKQPGDRYATARAFVDALERAMAGEKVVESPALTVQPPAPVSAAGTFGETVTLPAPVIEPEETAGPVAMESPPAPVIEPEEMAGLAGVAPPPAPIIEPEETAGPVAMESPPAPVIEPEEMAGPADMAPPPAPEPGISAAERVSRLVTAWQEMPVWVRASAGLAVLALLVGVVIAGVGWPVGGGRMQSTSGSLAPAQFFVSNRDGKREVYRLSGVGVERVTHTPGYDESWEPANGARSDVLFTSNRNGKREVYRLSEAGVERVTHTPGDGESWEPATGAGGDVFFTSNRDGKLEVYRLGEAGVERVTHTAGDGESWEPAKGAGGDIFFTSNRDGKREVYRLSEAGVERVTHTPGYDESWEPAAGTGRDIFFTSNRDGKREVYRLGEAGVERVTHTPGDGESWEPFAGAGGILLFTSNRDGKLEVYRLSEAGVERVTHTAGNGESWLSTR